MNQQIYVIIPLFTLLALFLYLYIRKAYAIRRVCAMSVPDKLERLNQITIPFGFEYRLSQDIFTSRPDAWQRECGYTEQDIARLREHKVVGMAGDPDVHDRTWDSKFGKGT